MLVALTPRFRSEAAALENTARASVFDVLLAIPRVMGDPHLHAGLGVRKLHGSGVWEARVGLGLRLVFTLAADTLTLVTVGSHDDVRRFLKNL